MKHARWQSCNVLQTGPVDAHLWHFTADASQPALSSEIRQPAQSPLPPRAVRKSLGHLWHRRINVAWLPASKVFFRVLQLPPCDPKELAPMVELQLEKLSPLPTNQICWSIQPIPRPPDKREQQTVLLILVASDVVEAFLGQLESVGYLPDRIEVPLLHELLAIGSPADGAWIYLRQADGDTRGLVAWWHGGVLQNLDLLQLNPATPTAQHLGNVLSALARAGQFEGWLTAPPQWRLVADPVAAATWQPALETWVGTPVELTPALPDARIAALTAHHAASSSALPNLLPAEHKSRYRQEFIDRLWMRGLGVLVALYLAAVGVYFAAVRYLSHQLDQVNIATRQIAPAYTNALELKAKAEILQEQVNLKFAALDCWKATSDLLPEKLQLLQFNFQAGRTLTLIGTVPADSQNSVTEFNSELKKTALNSTPLFSAVEPPSFSLSQATTAAAAAAEPLARWTFKCELNRSDLP